MNKYLNILIFLVLGTISFSCINTPKSQVIFQEQWYLRTKDKKAHLFIKEIGIGDPVIVIHGGPGVGHRTLLDISEHLTSKFKFIFYDQRGFGLSTIQDSVSMQKHIEDIETIRQAYSLEKVNLVSHSFGTMMAMNYLEQFPDNVKNIVLLGAMDPKNGDLSYFTEDEIKSFKTRSKEADEFYNRKPVKNLIDSLELNKKNNTPKEKNKYWNIRQSTANIYDVSKWKKLDRTMIDNYKASVQTRQSTNFNYDWAEILNNHKYKVTVINGVYDFEIGSKGSPIWKRVASTEAKNVNLVLLDSASHHSWIDKPVRFKDELEKALN